MKPLTHVEWLGFAPDADPTAPGVITSCSMLVPNDRGMIAYPRPTFTSSQTGAPSATVETLGFIEGMNSYFFAGSGTRIYQINDQLSGNGWKDVTPTTTYTAINEGVWTFDSFGQYALAAYGDTKFLNTATVPLLASFGGDNTFVPVSGAPMASVLAVASGFVMLMNYNDASAQYPDGWWCSARYDHTSWTLTPGASTKGRLVDSQGPITAAIEFDNAIYAFKRNSFYRGSYVDGSLTVWEWDKLPFKVGCRTQKMVCRDDSRIYFVTEDDIYSFDGANLAPLMSGKVKRWFQGAFALALQYYLNRVQLKYDAATSSVVLMFQHSVGNMIMLVYHVPTARFGFGDSIYDAVVVGKPITLGPAMYGIRSADHKAYRITGDFNYVTGQPYPTLVTGDWGDDREAVEETEVRLRLLTAPAISRGSIQTRETLDASLGAATTVNRSADGKYELRRNARWARYSFEFDGHVETTGFLVDATKRGPR